MSCGKSQVPPQKWPYMWMSCGKSQVPPQKQSNIWINTINSGCCHRKASGASAYKKSS
ncbi:MAG TPA: hypothetical protein P5167_03055 [Bacteroidales bacterium]|nr:hypothetical protein [Bacteroidales bacterium]